MVMRDVIMENARRNYLHIPEQDSINQFHGHVMVNFNTRCLIIQQLGKLFIRLHKFRL